MQIRSAYIINYFVGAMLLVSCASRKQLTSSFYHQNEKELVSIENKFRSLYDKNPFSIEFIDKSFNFINIEIITDSLKRIYEFDIRKQNLRDTLTKYGMPVSEITDLVAQMKSIHCIWINVLDYYTNNRRNYLVLLSIRPLAVRLPFTKEKYLILTFYEQPQYFDEEGNLLDNRRLRRLRKVNGEIFRRINSKVCYTVSGKFR